MLFVHVHDHFHVQLRTGFVTITFGVCNNYVWGLYHDHDHIHFYEERQSVKRWQLSFIFQTGKLKPACASMPCCVFIPYCKILIFTCTFYAYRYGKVIVHIIFQNCQVLARRNLRNLYSKSWGQFTKWHISVTSAALVLEKMIQSS